MNAIRSLLLLTATYSCFTVASDDVITPYKFTEAERKAGYGLSSNKASQYRIPESCRFTVPRNRQNTPDIVYYLSKPQRETYPIAFLCGGSTNKQSLESIIHFHRYLLQECMDIGIAVITVELWGIDGTIINEQECMHNYTRSQRLQDHSAVVEHIKQHPPDGWNGKFVFIGASEGGPLVTSLTTRYVDRTIATINWCGAGDWSWRQELWSFIKDFKNNVQWKESPWYIKLYLKLRLALPRWLPFSIDFPRNQDEYNQQMDKALIDPSSDIYFLGMTYKYHADAMRYPRYEYEKIKTPFLVVAGAQDNIIDSSDAFVQKAREAGVNITYVRVPDMGHYIRKRPDIVAQSFEWLDKQIHLP